MSELQFKIIPSNEIIRLYHNPESSVPADQAQLNLASHVAELTGVYIGNVVPLNKYNHDKAIEEGKRNCRWQQLKTTLVNFAKYLGIMSRNSLKD